MKFRVSAKMVKVTYFRNSNTKDPVTDYIHINEIIESDYDLDPELAQEKIETLPKFYGKLFEWLDEVRIEKL